MHKKNGLGSPTDLGLKTISLVIWTSQSVNNLKQKQTDDLPPLLSTASGHFTGLFVSTNWFFHTRVGYLPREEELSFRFLLFSSLPSLKRQLKCRSACNLQRIKIVHLLLYLSSTNSVKLKLEVKISDTVNDIWIF